MASRTKLLLLLISSLLLLLLLILTITISTTTRRRTTTAASQSILHSSCMSTPYPSLCFSSISGNHSLLSSISSHSDVLHASLLLTITAVHHSFTAVTNLTRRAGLTARELAALHDCMEVLEDTLDQLRIADTTKKTAADVKILISAAITNQDSCLDGFSHDGADRGLRRLIIAGVMHVRRMCRNALSMIKKGTVVSHDEGMHERRRKVEEQVEVVVAKDGSGDYRTVGEAVEAAPAKSEKRHVIRIKEGRYEENVEVKKKKTNIMFVGEGRDKTVISGSRNVVDGSTTFKSATLGQ